MWFKNLILFRVTETDWDPRQLPETLATRLARACGPLEMQTWGWAAPAHQEGAPLVHENPEGVLFCVKRYEKLLPASVVNEFLQDRVRELEIQKGQKLSRKAVTALRDEVVQDLLPKAFSRGQKVYAFLDRQTGLLGVDAATQKRAEELVSSLRETLGSFACRPYELKESVSGQMTRWLLGEDRHPQFTLGDTCELIDPAVDGGTIRCRRLDLDTEEIRNHLLAGRQVNQLALDWSERIQFTLTQEFMIKQLVFGDDLRESAASEAEDLLSRMDADFFLMLRELRALVSALAECFGGEIDASQ